MEDIINIYCDESHPMQNDGQDFMVIGSLICHKSKYRKIRKNIQSIKRNNGLDMDYEFKWQKVNKKRINAYIDLMNFVANCDDIKIKINLALGKRLLIFSDKKFSYDMWYHRMYYYMLKNYLKWHKEYTTDCTYNLFIDKKDTHSKDNYGKIASHLHRYFKPSGGFAAKACDSKEHLLIQAIDIIIGAVSYYQRRMYANKYKTQLMKHIINLYGVSFDKSTGKKEDKFSLYVWKPEIR